MAMRPVLIGTDPFDSMRSRSAVIDCVGGEAGMQPSVGLGVIANNLTATTNMTPAMEGANDGEPMGPKNLEPR